jgi:hypothetical protein
MSGIRREHARVLNVDDETGHMEPRSAAGTGSVTATGGRSCRVADGASEPRVAHNGPARNGDAHIGIARGGVPHADVLDGLRHDTDGPEPRTSGPKHHTSGPEPRTAGPTSAPTTRSGRGAANAGRPTEAGR